MPTPTSEREMHPTSVKREGGDAREFARRERKRAAPPAACMLNLAALVLTLGELSACITRAVLILRHHKLGNREAA